MEGPASLLLLKHGAILSCHIVDLSIGGCRIEADHPFTAGLEQRVEVAFTARGLPMRCIGNIRWTDGSRQIGIRFEEMSARLRVELIEIVHELEEAHAARLTAEAAAEAEAAEKVQGAELVCDDSARQAADTIERPRTETARAEAAPVSIKRPAAVEAFPVPSRRERRTQTRHKVDDAAAIFLVRGGSRLSGRIQDLSLSGCCICTNEPISVGIYIRVETEFFLHGFPFRLGGVIQAIRDRFHVGIRFLDVSDRKRRQIEELIAEIQVVEIQEAELQSAEPGKAEHDEME